MRQSVEGDQQTISRRSVSLRIICSSDHGAFLKLFVSYAG